MSITTTIELRNVGGSKLCCDMCSLKRLSARKDVIEKHTIAAAHAFNHLAFSRTCSDVFVT